MPYGVDNYENFAQVFASDKTINYVSSRLTSANKIAKKGGHVVMEKSDQVFRLLYDNRRILKDVDGIDLTEKMLDSAPLNKADEAGVLRTLSKITSKNVYQKNTSLSNKIVKYKNENEICVRSFIKALFYEALNTSYRVFESYSELVTFVKEIDKGVKLNPNILAILKNRCAIGDYNKNQVLKNKYSLKFVEGIKKRFPDFSEQDFFK